MSTPILSKRSRWGGKPSARTRSGPTRRNTSSVSTVPSSTRPVTATISRVRRRSRASSSRWTTRSIAPATAGTTKPAVTLGPASSGRVQSFVSASRALLAWRVDRPGSPDTHETLFT